MIPGDYSVIVFTKPNCQACVAVKRSLTSKGIAFDEGDAVANATFLREEMGFQQAPVTVFDGPNDEHIQFAGFDPFKIDEIYALITEADQEEP